MRELTHAAGLDIRYDATDGLGLVYTAYVSMDPREADLIPIASERRADYLRIPPGHERVIELARKVVGDARTTEEKIARILHFLRQGDYTYSLRQPDVGADPPLVAFLFNQKRGHCEYFATAMAIMLRAVGIPSRNVTGFVGGRYNPYGGYYALRQGDAHSWVEAYHEDRGFVTYDPTPPARAAEGPTENLWSDVNALIDALRTRWATNVVGYDLRVQVGMLRKLAAWANQWRHRGEGGSELGDGGGLFDGLHSLKSLARYGGVLAVLAALLFLAVRMLSAPLGARRDAAVERAISLYGELERALGARGHPRAPSVTPLEHAHALRAKGFAEAAEVLQVTDRYLEARFGGKPLRAAEVVELRRKIEKVRKAA